MHYCDEYKLKDAELEEHIDQKIEEIRSEISALESILETEQDLEETQEIEELLSIELEETEEQLSLFSEFELSTY